ncbi:AAA family ATPase [Bacillus cereus group sp. MYBK30-1]|uniref:AAA family ATPase n=1 Tax=unclassified Bacillus cereus group TaxID=2750818 RepID=UPI003F78F291
MFDIKFLDEKQDIDNKQNIDNKLFSTVIIGANGSGKSYLLSLITEVFRALESKKLNRDFTLRYEYYSIKYYLNHTIYSVEIFKKRFKILKKELSKKGISKEYTQVSIDEVDIPWRILAVSFMINDKFTFQSDDRNPDTNYKYLGVRRTSNATWTNSIVRKISDALISHASVEGFYDKVRDILDFLKYQPKIKLIFEPVTKNFFKKGISYEQLQTKIDNITNTEEYRAFSINKFRDKEFQVLMRYINETVMEREKINVNNKMGIQYTIDFTEEGGNFELLQDYKIIQYLVDMRLLKAPILLLSKNDEFEFENASSGEKQFLFTMLNIASKLEQNSLVLIDEPELSFHPNWQMLYINYLKKIFNDYPTCHFILATHSHYIVSDLEEGSSSIVILNNDDNEQTRKAELVQYSTFAWSAENILYNIFQVRTTRNYYFEMDLRKLVGMIKEKTKDLERLERLINKLKRYLFDESDPMIEIIEEAERYLENAKEN